jgi:outer membrane lipoprotein carrier protein
MPLLVRYSVLHLTLAWIFFLFAKLPATRDPKIAVRALESRYRHARTLKAEFFESYSDGNGGLAAESGTVYFSRPGRMRWEYESPEQKLFLVDGTNVWFYVPSDRTASRAKFKESSDWRTPLALLAGNADLGRLCRAVELVNPGSGPPDTSEARPSAIGNNLLRCIPRSRSDDAGNVLREVLLETDPEAHLVRVLLRQAGNVETEFRFAAWQENIVIPEAKFHFQPPPGVSIVDEESLARGIR